MPSDYKSNLDIQKFVAADMDFQTRRMRRYFQSEELYNAGMARGDNPERLRKQLKADIDCGNSNQSLQQQLLGFAKEDSDEEGEVRAYMNLDRCSQREGEEDEEEEEKDESVEQILARKPPPYKPVKGITVGGQEKEKKPATDKSKDAAAKKK